MKNILTLAIACFLVYAATAQDKTPASKTIAVTGIAEEEVTPDEIYVQVDLQEYDKRGEGKVDIETIKASFLAACKSIGIADTNISVLSYQGGEGYWQYRKTRKKNADVKTSVSYWVKVADTKKLDDLTDKLDDDAVQNFRIAKTAYSKITEAKKQLKIEAIKAAKAKAEYLTEAIGEHIGGAVTITDGDDVETIGLNRYISNRNYSTANSGFIGNVGYYNDIDTKGEIGFQKIKLQFQVGVVFELK